MMASVALDHLSLRSTVIAVNLGREKSEQPGPEAGLMQSSLGKFRSGSLLVPQSPLEKLGTK